MAAAEAGIDALLVSPALEASAATLYTLNLASALRATGTEVLVVTPGGPLLDTYRERGIPVRLSAYLMQPLIGRIAIHRLAKTLRARDVQIVHAQAFEAIAPARHLARQLGVPLCASVHRFAEEAADARWDGIAAILVVGDELREDCVNRRRAPRDRVRVVPAGLALDYEPLAPFAHGGAPVIGTLGEFEKIEAQEQFLHAAKEILTKAPDAQFLIVGQGQDGGRLRRLVAGLGIQANVTIAPAMDQRKALPVMDVCVLPSCEEGPAHMVLEAMAAARPVIAVGAGGAFAAVKDEETGLLVAKEDPHAMSEAVLRLLADKALARKMGESGRALTKERFPVERMRDETLEVYRRIREK